MRRSHRAFVCGDRVNDFIGALPEGVQRGAAASLANTKMSPADARRVQASLMKAFAPAKVDHAIRAEFVRSCDPGSLREAISDMSDPVAVRIASD